MEAHIHLKFEVERNSYSFKIRSRSISVFGGPFANISKGAKTKQNKTKTMFLNLVCVMCFTDLSNLTASTEGYYGKPWAGIVLMKA